MFGLRGLAGSETGLVLGYQVLVFCRLMFRRLLLQSFRSGFYSVCGWGVGPFGPQ